MSRRGGLCLSTSSRWGRRVCMGLILLVWVRSVLGNHRNATVRVPQVRFSPRIRCCGMHRLRPVRAAERRDLGMRWNWIRRRRVLARTTRFSLCRSVPATVLLLTEVPERLRPERLAGLAVWRLGASLRLTPAFRGRVACRRAETRWRTLGRPGAARSPCGGGSRPRRSMRLCAWRASGEAVVVCSARRRRRAAVDCVGSTRRRQLTAW